MCGRFALIATPGEVRHVFGYPESDVFPPRYNIAPTQPIAIVRTWSGRRHFILMRWGMIPHWVDDPRRFPLLINARAESAAERPAFRDALRYRRCLVPASGYFEWSGTGNGRRPFWIRPRRGRVIAFAGLYETWSDRQNGGEVDTACILTTEANASLQSVGERMPVLIARSDFDRWLSGDQREVTQLLNAPPAEPLDAVLVGTRVNKSGNDGPGLIEPAPVHDEVPFD
jgi:putative SOS response-associated peptidase YedK